MGSEGHFTDLRVVTHQHGEVKKVHMMRGVDGLSGSAMVHFAKKSDAQSAISALHGTTGYPNGSRPLVVKFASDKYYDAYAHAPHMYPAGQYVGYHPNYFPSPTAMQGAGGGYMTAPLNGNSPATGYKLFVGMIPYCTGQSCPFISAMYMSLLINISCN